MTTEFLPVLPGLLFLGVEDGAEAGATVVLMSLSKSSILTLGGFISTGAGAGAGAFMADLR